MFKTKYRVKQHPDTEGFPNHWLIQYKRWYSKKWKFACGYYPSEEEAVKCMNAGEGSWLRGIQFSYKPRPTFYLQLDSERIELPMPIGYEDIDITINIKKHA